MPFGVVVLITAVSLAVGFGSFRALGDGHFRGTRRLKAIAPPNHSAVESEVSVVERSRDHSVLEDTPWAEDLGERATLLQFSSAFCTPCRATRRVLGQVTTAVPGVAHIEVDAEHHLDVVRRLGILRTPTTLVLDRSGRELNRASGAPSKEQVLVALEKAIG